MDILNAMDLFQGGFGVLAIAHMQSIFDKFELQSAPRMVTADLRFKTIITLVVYVCNCSSSVNLVLRFNACIRYLLSCCDVGLQELSAQR
jgi:hypothetical protein